MLEKPLYQFGRFARGVCAPKRTCIDCIASTNRIVLARARNSVPVSPTPSTKVAMKNKKTADKLTCFFSALLSCHLRSGDSG